MIVKRKSTGEADGLTIGFKGEYEGVMQKHGKQKNSSESAHQAIILFAKVQKL